MTTRNEKLKQWMKNAQKDAKEIMIKSGNIWQEEGWRSGGQVNQEILKAKLVQRLKKKKYPNKCVFCGKTISEGKPCSCLFGGSFG